MPSASLSWPVHKHPLWQRSAGLRSLSVLNVTSEASPARLTRSAPLSAPTFSHVCEGQVSSVCVGARRLPPEPRSSTAFQTPDRGPPATCTNRARPACGVWPWSHIPPGTLPPAPKVSIAASVSTAAAFSHQSGRRGGSPGATITGHTAHAWRACCGQASHVARDSVKGQRAVGAPREGEGLLWELQVCTWTAWCPTPAGTSRASGHVRDTVHASLCAPGLRAS